MKNPKHILSAMTAIIISFALFAQWAFNEESKKLVDAPQEASVSHYDMKPSRLGFKPVDRRPKAPRFGEFPKPKIAEDTTTLVSPEKNEEALKKLLAKQKKKEADAKKKKKKKKKVAKKKGEKKDRKIADKKTDFDNLIEETKRKAEAETEPQTLIYAAALPQRPTNKEEEKVLENKRTLEEWRSLLLFAPNPHERERLVQDYLSHQLDSPQWYYLLSQEMLASSIPEVRKEGLLAIDAVKRIETFTVLVAAKKDLAPLPEENTDETNLAFGKSLETALESYAVGTKHILVLGQALKSPQEEVKAEAARLIALSIEKNLAPKEQDGEKPVLSPNDLKSYERIYANLDDSLKREKNEHIKQLFADTLKLLRTYLSVA